MQTDLYVLLGVPRDASPHQIQAAYAHWAKDLQPERDTPTSEGLRQLEDAYAVLANPERRLAYDSKANEGPGQGKRAEPLEDPVRHTRKRQEISLRESFETCQPSFEELFERFWSNFEGVTRPKAEHFESLTLEIPLTASQAVAGGQATVLIPARAQCPSCLGHGALGVYQCWRCEGHGSITADYPLNVSYPAGITGEYIVQVPLESFGIRNFYLTVRFRN